MHFSLVSANTLAAFGFAIAAVGIIIQILAGVVSTKVPAGAIILMIIAIFTIIKAWPWMPGVGVGATVLLIIGALVAGGVITRLTHVSQLGPFLGTLIQLAGMAIGFIAGILAVISNYTK